MAISIVSKHLLSNYTQNIGLQLNQENLLQFLKCTYFLIHRLYQNWLYHNLYIEAKIKLINLVLLVEILELLPHYKLMKSQFGLKTEKLYYLRQLLFQFPEELLLSLPEELEMN